MRKKKRRTARDVFLQSSRMCFDLFSRSALPFPPRLSFLSALGPSDLLPNAAAVLIAVAAFTASAGKPSMGERSAKTDAVRGPREGKMMDRTSSVEEEKDRGSGCVDAKRIKSSRESCFHTALVHWPFASSRISYKVLSRRSTELPGLMERKRHKS